MRAFSELSKPVPMLTEARTNSQFASLTDQAILQSQLKQLALADEQQEELDNTDPFERTQPVSTPAPNHSDLCILEKHIFKYKS